MSQSISRESRERATTPPDSRPQPTRTNLTLILGIRIFVGVMVATAVALTSAQIAVNPDGVILIALATTSAVLAGLGGVVLCLEALLASRGEFYRRGQLDGWMRGWRGQEPELDDPLVR